MANEIAVTGFDYSKLDSETVSKLKYYSKAGHGLLRKSHIRFIADFGEILSDARKLLASHGDGTFIKWATTEFDFSSKTIYNYLNAWDRCLCNGYTNFENLTPTALYLLTTDDMPKSVLDKALKLAGKQQFVTKADVQLLLGHKPETSEPGKPGGAPPSSSKNTPAPSGPASGGAAETPQEAPPPDYGRCPNCAGMKWDEDEDGVSCAKCHHPHGEPADTDEDRVATQRSKTVKTVEALLRAFDDLNLLLPRKEHPGAIRDCKALLKLAKDWK